jgi:hypothetical protein
MTRKRKLILAGMVVGSALFVGIVVAARGTGGVPKIDDGIFHVAQVRYERLLASVGRGDTENENDLGQAWDTLLSSFGSAGRIPPLASDSHNVAPMTVQAVWRDPSAARLRAGKTDDNPKVLQIRADDQTARDGLEKLSPAWLIVHLFAMWPADHWRARRIQNIAASGGLVTSNDFACAALVMQHSTRIEGYELAHELAVCSLLLGDRKEGRNLVAYTYDRMLESIGQRQRFATQYDSEGLSPVDTDGIDDTERIALGCPPLDKARDQH